MIYVLNGVYLVHYGVVKKQLPGCNKIDIICRDLIPEVGKHVFLKVYFVFHNVSKKQFFLEKKK